MFIKYIWILFICLFIGCKSITRKENINTKEKKLEIKQEKNIKEMLEDFDKYIGEHQFGELIENITKLGKKALSYVEKKREEYRGKNKFREEVLDDIIIAIKNDIIMWADCPDEIEATKIGLWDIQSCLDKYYRENNLYPKELSKLVKEFPSEILDFMLDDQWKTPFNYKSVGRNYYLSSSGPDGKQYTDDDILAPIDKEKHKFPNEKRNDLNIK